MHWFFEDRSQAGVLLAQYLKQYRSRALAIAVGAAGVPVAVEVARLLHIPLGIVPAKRLTGPDGLTFGALAPGGVAVVDWPRLERVGEELARSIVRTQQRELARLETVYGEFARLPVARRTVILIADGMESGMTARAALRVVRVCHPAQVIVAAPVVSEAAYRDLKEEAGQCVCLATRIGPDARVIHRPDSAASTGLTGSSSSNTTGRLAVSKDVRSEVRASLPSCGPEASARTDPEPARSIAIASSRMTISRRSAPTRVLAGEKSIGTHSDRIVRAIGEFDRQVKAIETTTFHDLFELDAPCRAVASLRNE